jgi:hypothetical protein
MADYSKSTASNAKQSVPALSAIVVIPDKFETVRKTLHCLQQQTAAKLMEIVIVAPDSGREIVEDELKSFHSWQIVPVDKVHSISGGFTAGILKARAPLVALTEDHSLPDIYWAELFIRDHRQPWAAVGPSMQNANPDSPVSWADFFQAYGDWTRPINPGEVRHLPGHNSCYKREILLSFGEKLPILMQAESILHRHLTAKGHKLFLEPGTCTSHQNFNSWSTWIPARYYAGREFAGTWAKWWPWYRRAVFTIASPGIPFLRFSRIQKNINRNNVSSRLYWRLLPALIVGLILDGIGQIVGYAAGIGDAGEKMVYYEFHRVKPA